MSRLSSAVASPIVQDLKGSNNVIREIKKEGSAKIRSILEMPQARIPQIATMKKIQDHHPILADKICLMNRMIMTQAMGKALQALRRCKVAKKIHAKMAASAR